MDFVLRDQVWICNPLEKAGFPHGFGTRFGPPMTSQDPQCLRQIHSDQFHFISQKNKDLEGDAMATDQFSFPLGIRTADCIPLLLGDPISQICVGIHAGWRGTVKMIVRKTIQTLKNQHQLNVSKTIVAIGPAACSNCYEVGSEVRAEAEEKLTNVGGIFKESKPNHFLFDTVRANFMQLEEVGILKHNIYESGMCTMHQNNQFFSHRIEGQNNPGFVGRNLSVISQRK